MLKKIRKNNNNKNLLYFYKVLRKKGMNYEKERKREVSMEFLIFFVASFFFKYKLKKHNKNMIFNFEIFKFRKKKAIIKRYIFAKFAVKKIFFLKSNFKNYWRKNLTKRKKQKTIFKKIYVKKIKNIYDNYMQIERFLSKKFLSLKKNIKKYKKKRTLKKKNLMIQIKTKKKNKYILKKNIHKIFKYFKNDARFIVKRTNIRTQKKKRRQLIFLLKYRLFRLATRDINFIKIKLSVKNIFISFFRRIKGLFLKANCGYYGFTGAKKSTTFAYEHTASNITKLYYTKYYISLKYRNLKDKIARRRKKRKACLLFYRKNPLFFNLQHHIHRRQIRSIIRGFKKSRLGISFLNYHPKTAHNGLWLRKKKRV